MIAKRIEKIHNHRRTIRKVHLHSRKPIQLILGTLIHRAVGVIKVLAEEAVSQYVDSETRDVFKVAQWKWNIDKGAPLWKRLFFKWIFLPFQGFAFRLGIPTPKEVVIESDPDGRTRKTFRWWEDEGIFACADQAEVGCLEEHWGYTNLPFGRLMPPGSAQYGVTIFPRKQRGSQQWAKLAFPIILKDRKQEEREQRILRDGLAELNRVLDR